MGEGKRVRDDDPRILELTPLRPGFALRSQQVYYPEHRARQGFGELARTSARTQFLEDVVTVSSWIKRVAIYICTGGLVGCSPLDAVNVLTPSAAYVQHRDIQYAETEKSSLDVYVPSANTTKARDVILFYYGGLWRKGAKEQYRFVADVYAALGYVVVIPDFRKYPDVDWTGMIADVAEAYRWTTEHIEGYGGNPSRIFLLGHSSGAHLAAMIAFDQKLREGVASPCGFVGLSGPYDFAPIGDEDVREVFSSAHDPRATQPITFASRGDPAALLLTGAEDETVEPGNSARLADRLSQVGVQAQVISYPDVGHAGLLISLTPINSKNASTVEDSVAFMRQRSCY